MLLKKEIFNKFIKLISAGIIQTSAKNIKGLSIKEFLSLPLTGKQIVSFNVDNINFLDSATYDENIDYKSKYNYPKELIFKMNFETKFKEFLQTALKVLENELTIIEKNKTKYSYYISFTNCNIIVNNCIIDTNTNRYGYTIVFGNNIQEEIDTINLLLNDTLKLQAMIEFIYNLNKLLYIDDILGTQYTKYPILKTLSEEIIIILDNSDAIDDNITNEEKFQQWFSDLLNSLNLYIDFELGLLDISNEELSNGLSEQSKIVILDILNPLE